MLPIESHVLGSSAARPYVDCGTSSIFVQAGGTRILIDCGEGTQVELDRRGLSAQKLDLVCITHMHGDHIYGLPGLLSSLALGQRSKMLRILGPPNLEDYINAVLEHSSATLSYPIEYSALQYGSPSKDVLELRDLTVSTIPLKHRIDACGFVIEQRSTGRSLKHGVVEKYQIPFSSIPAIKNGSDFKSEAGEVVKNVDLTDAPKLPTPIAYLTDTAPLESYPSNWEPPHLLYHDATFAKSDVALARKTGHSTVFEAAAFAKTSNAKELVLIHTSKRYKDLLLLLSEAKALFDNTRLP